VPIFPPVPENERERLAALRALGVLDTPMEPVYQALVELAAATCATPMAMISLIDAHRQWFKAHVGAGSVEEPRDITFCAHAITEPGFMEVSDARLDARFHDNPLVLGAPHIRFYAGAQIVDANGYALGTVCVIDREPRRLDDTQRAVLRRLATVVTSLFDATARLRESERRVADIAENVPAAIGYADRDERLRFANRELLRFLQRPADRVVGADLRELFGSEYDTRAPYVHAALAGQRVQYERDVELDGVVHHLETRYAPDLDEHGVARGFYGVTVDVSRLKKAERRLAESEARLRTITDNLPALICLIDREGRYVFNNLTFEHWLRRPRSEITGRLVSEVHGERLWRMIEPRLARAFTGERVTFEYDVEYDDGVRYLRGTYVPARDEQRRITGVYSLIQDATELWRSEQQLRQLAEFDTLTGLANRHHLMQQLGARLRQCEADGGGLAVLYLDVDRFKAINDGLGHLGGDLVLCEFAQRLSACVRTGDLVARLAGDEFVIVL